MQCRLGAHKQSCIHVAYGLIELSLAQFWAFLFICSVLGLKRKLYVRSCSLKYCITHIYIYIYNMLSFLFAFD